jgi:hypothetical protein
MAVAKRSAPLVRPRYVLAVVAIGTGLAAFGGCKHHRYGAMRPQFVGPATVVPVEPSPAPGIAAPAFEDEAVTPPSLLAPAAPAVRPGLRGEPHLEPSPADPAAAEPDENGVSPQRYETSHRTHQRSPVPRAGCRRVGKGP